MQIAALPFKAEKPARHSVTNGGRIAVQIGGVLRYFLDKLFSCCFPYLPVVDAFLRF